MSGAEDLWWQERTARHEAGHVVMAALLRHRLGPVTIEPSPGSSGCAWAWSPKLRADDLARVAEQPAPLLPARVRRNVEGTIMSLAAGEAAAEVWLRRQARGGRQPAPLVERVAERIEAAAPLTRSERELLATREVTETMEEGHDEPRIERLAMLLNHGDVTAAAVHASYLTIVAKGMLEREFKTVERIAAALVEHRTLSALTVRELVR
jgi:hypothetical protein